MATADDYTRNVEALARRFDVGCLVALLPRAHRAAALAELVDADPDFFFLGHDHPPTVTDSAVTDGTPAVRRSLARTVRDPQAQHRLLDLDDAGVDARLADNPSLAYRAECRLRLRRPTVVAAAGGYRPEHHRAALTSGDPDLAAAALIDRRTYRWGDPIPPTVWATAWRTVRLAGGPARVRQVLAALPPGTDPDEATRRIARACAEPDPEPFLATTEDLLTGTGALLRRLRRIRTAADARRGRAILGEPYRVDWALVASAGLSRRLPRQAARLLARHPDCPSDVARVLLTGRPAPRHLPAPTDTGPAPRADRPPPPAYRRRPPVLGPLDAADPLAVLAATPVGTDGLDIHHVWSAIELGRITARQAVDHARPAYAVACHAGQTSAFQAATREPGGGRAALHAATLAHLAAHLAAHPPAPGLWREIDALIRPFPGPLPALLTAAATRARTTAPPARSRPHPWPTSWLTSRQPGES
ncbi:hypothetical protein PUR71_23185 [Streptomyces sp. SP17BM10]|uniref:hypothetical protein n=1 Tax=Streptomyces sp. SP17BM10 TaxID=3002530 RepID=UPI002E7684C0|nr:hypothetical protein [Streptomyces sp. SP17BM10]MEE1785786.1 hypothetical protein [Streptomyces sp. SP17BM10]